MDKIILFIDMLAKLIMYVKMKSYVIINIMLKLSNAYILLQILLTLC